MVNNPASCVFLRGDVMQLQLIQQLDLLVFRRGAVRQQLQLDA